MFLPLRQILRPSRGRRLAADETIFFVHIPKAAGSSFRSVLKRWFGDGLMIFDSHDRAAFGEACAARSSPPRAVAGHFLHGLHLGCEGIKPCYVSLVRDPVERLTSLYKHARQTPDHPMHPAAAALDLEGFHRHGLEDPRARRRLVGIQCYFLTGERTFQAARPALKPYRLLAPVDRFGQFVADAAALCGKPAPPQPFRNRRPSEPALQEAVAALAHRIREDHCEDQRLYEHVCARFDAAGGSVLNTRRARQDRAAPCP